MARRVADDDAQPDMADMKTSGSMHATTGNLARQRAMGDHMSKLHSRSPACGRYAYPPRPRVSNGLPAARVARRRAAR